MLWWKPGVYLTWAWIVTGCDRQTIANTCLAHSKSHLKIAVFNHHSFVCCPPLQKIPANIHIIVYCLTAESLAYMGLYSFKFPWWAPMHHLCSRMQLLRYTCSRSSKISDFGTNRKCLWDFLLVINSTATFFLILHHLCDSQLIGWKLQIFTIPVN